MRFSFKRMAIACYGYIIALAKGKMNKICGYLWFVGLEFCFQRHYRPLRPPSPSPCYMPGLCVPVREISYLAAITASQCSSLCCIFQAKPWVSGSFFSCSSFRTWESHLAFFAWLGLGFSRLELGRCTSTCLHHPTCGQSGFGAHAKTVR